MRILVGTLFALATLSGTLHAAPLNPGTIPNDAKWVIHIDLERWSDSVLAERIRDKHAEKVKKMHEWLQDRYGIDPQEDLKSLTMFSDDYEPHSGAAILTASYDKEKVTQALEKAGAKTSKAGDHVLYTYTMKKHKGGKKSHDAHANGARKHGSADDGDNASKQHAKQHDKRGARKHRDGKKVTAVLFSDEMIIFAPNAKRAKAVISLLEGEQDSLEDADSKLIANLPTGAIFYGAAVDLGELGDRVRPFPVLQQHEHVRIAFGQKGDTLYKHVTLVAKESDVAEEMKTALEGFVALAKVCAGDAETVAELYDDVEIEQDGAKVTASWEGDVDDLMTALDELQPRFEAWRKLHHKR